MESLDSILKNIKNQLKKRPEIVAGYLYGSYARGTQVKGSDIDIGILLNPDFKADNLYYLGALYNDFNFLSKDYDIQAFTINDKSPMFRHEVISPRKILFCRDDDIRADFEVKTMRDYFEMRPYYKLSYESAIAGVRERLHVSK